MKPSDLRVVTRPLVTLWLTAASTGLAIWEAYWAHVTPTWFAAMTGGAVGWWFYDRYRQRIQGKEQTNEGS